MSPADKGFTDRIAGLVRGFDMDARIFLYGRNPCGEPGEGEAWDILVVTAERMSLQRERALRSGLYSLELETGQVITAGIRSRRDWTAKSSRVTPFHHNVVSEGTLL